VRETPDRSNRSTAAALAAFLFLGAIAWASVASIQPPAAAPTDAPAAEFSSGRAMRHVRAIAARPHPTGTAENARVRDYLVGELRSLGLETEVQAAEAVAAPSYAGGAAVAGRVENVVARRRGTGGGRALMLAAHYDSVPTAPGATDDAAGVAAILETLRALGEGPPPANDLVVLFTDGEELGLLGARAFAAEHPWMNEVALVLNFEGRGAGGPSMMFETSAGNRALVSELSAAAPRPVASSLMYEAYKRLPNDTDMTVFREAGAAGLNFAYAARLTHYHTALDSADELDERSLQHHGTYALSLARRFGGLDLRTLTGAGGGVGDGGDVGAGVNREGGGNVTGDAVFFNLFGPMLVSYPAGWVVPLTLALIVAFAAVLALGLRRRRLSAKGIAAGWFALLVAGAAAGLSAAGAWRAVKALHAGFESLPWQTPYDSWLYELGFVLLAVAAASGVYALAFRRASGLDLLAGALVWWALALLLTTALVPSASYLFAWPLLFAVAGLAFRVLRGADDGGGAAPFVSALAAAPAVAFVAPSVYLFGMMMGLELSGYLMVLVVLALAPAVTLLRGGVSARRWLLPGAATLAGLAFVVAGLSSAGFDARHKKVNHLFYQLDADAGRAAWTTSDRERDEWTSQFFTAAARRVEPEAWRSWGRRAMWEDDAPALPLAAPTLEVLEDRTEGEARRLRLRVASPRGAQMLMVSAASTGVTKAQINGREAWSAPGSPTAGAGGGQQTPPALLRVSYSAPPVEGFELQIEARAGVEVSLVVEDITFGLPAEALAGRGPRPDHMMPLPNYRWSDTTLVRRAVSLPAAGGAGL